MIKFYLFFHTRREGKALSSELNLELANYKNIANLAELSNFSTFLMINSLGRDDDPYPLQSHFFEVIRRAAGYYCICGTTRRAFTISIFFSLPFSENVFFPSAKKFFLNKPYLNL